MAEDGFRVRGYKPQHPTASLLKTSRARVRAELRPATFRSGTELEATETVRNDDLVELEFEDGLRLWLRGDEYRVKATAEVKRTRGALPADGVLEVPVAWPVEGTSGERGFSGLALKALKLVGLDPVQESVKVIAARFEAGKPRDPKRPGPGFYRVRPVTGAFALEAAGTVPTGAPVLVLVHGTASSTWGSFGDLWSTARSGTLAKLRARYGDNVFALEHRSLTESVIANARTLATELPDGAVIDVLTHSRGGLVGELLSRGNVTGGDPFDATEIELAGELRGVADGDEAAQAGLRKARDDLTELGRVLKAKRIKVGSLVRVACPALGTTLVSGKLDRWLSIVANVGGLAAPASPVADLAGELGDLLAAVLEKKTDPATLPGLAFFLPEAGLLRVLNNPERRIASRLAVIAGEIDSKGVWSRLLTLVLDRFYEGAHDLVVNTESMYGGTPRTGGNALLSGHRGAAVNHFNYFTNGESAEAIVAALAAAPGAAVTGFAPLRPPTRAIARGGEFTRAPAGPAPYVFVLPGIMGSELAAGEDRIWLDYWRLARGRLARLAIEAADVRAVAPYGDYYGDLLEFLAATHKVVPFAFDWRLAPEAEADRLAQALREKVDDAKREGVPVRILAHSMGGLVTRAMIARHPELWRELAALAGARFVMLGTPNGGSHAITELLVGRSETFGALALLDVTHSTRELLEIVARFPGVLAMLPNHGGEDWFDPAVWGRFAHAAGLGWVPPAAVDLDRARAFRALIDAAPIEPERMVYVAGSAPVTAQAMRLGFSTTGASTIEFEGTVEGDGRVTWASGVPAGLRPWYMPVAHGDLSATADYFPAILDLLQTGRTDKLAQTAPVQRGAEKPFVVVRAPAQSLPDEQSLGAAVMGGAPRRSKPPPPAAIEVSVLNGDLAYARDPVMVGHYAGDTIMAAEAELDRWLGGRLSELRDLRLYPGPIETAEVVLDPTPYAPDRVQGAVVVGLGQPGELTVDRLKRSIAHGALTYAIRQEQCRPRRAAPDEGGVRELALASLLIGTQAGGVRVPDAVMAIVEGVQRANAALEAAGRPVRIARIQLIELWQDHALQAVDALALLAERSHLRGTFRFDGIVRQERGGRQRLSYDAPGGWWQRLQIRGDKGDGRTGELRFLALTQRARAEVTTTATQRTLVDEFVKRALRSNATDPAIGATLFELLLPNALKDQAPEQDNLQLVLDEAAAEYPWELLEDPARKGAKPFAVERGMLRQLQTERYQPGVRSTAEDTALVIGDPQLPEGGGELKLKQLPGAREEAGLVAGRLRGSGVETALLEGPSAVEVLKELFARPYKMLHLAGHGVYRQEVREADGSTKLVTGMVLGKDLYLSPAEVKQMRSVPEVVFINCCHLGSVEDRAADPTKEPQFNRLAANVAAQFIDMGVRAVVAAGWAIDDRAAKTFADRFYEGLLGGETFGEAVKAGREKTWSEHRYANTWGAYQCYGDPEYRLRLAGGRAGARKVVLRSVADAVCTIENVQRDLLVRAAQPVEGALEKLNAIVDEIVQRGWSGEARCWVALARAHGEAQDFARAIACYERASAVKGGDAGLGVRDLEQLSNYETRLALREWQTRTREVPPLLERIGGAVRRLEWLIGRGAALPAGWPRGGAACPGATEERFNLLGSACKRRAWIDPANRARDLQSMHDAYAVAFDIARSAKRDTAYPLLNKIQAALVLRWQGVAGAPDVGAEDRHAIRAAAEHLETQAAAATDFWTSVSLADHALTVALLDRKLDRAEEERLATLYLAARRFGSPREFASVLDQLDFLAAMATNESIREPVKRISFRASGGGDSQTRGGGSGGLPPAAGSTAPPDAGSAPPAPAAADAGAGAAPRGPEIPAGQPQEVAAGPMTDVALAAAAPGAVRPGDQFLAQFAAYPATAKEERKVAALFDADSIPELGKQHCRWADGTEVTVRLSGDRFKAQPAEQPLVWNGRRQVLDFQVTVDPAARLGNAFLGFEVVVAGLPIQRLMLKIGISRQPKKAGKAAAKDSALKSAFASYSSKDRVDVAKIVDALKLTNIDFFLDCLDLKPGEAWKKRLREEIRQRDVFWLFWSKSAAASKWVTWEWRTALRLKKKAGIQPYSLPPPADPADPPKALQALQFTSALTAISELAARREAEKGR